MEGARRALRGGRGERAAAVNGRGGRVELVGAFAVLGPLAVQKATQRRHRGGVECVLPLSALAVRARNACRSLRYRYHRTGMCALNGRQSIGQSRVQLCQDWRQDIAGTAGTTGRDASGLEIKITASEGGRVWRFPCLLPHRPRTPGASKVQTVDASTKFASMQVISHNI